MNEYLHKLSAMMSSHSNFSLDGDKLQIFYNKKSNSSHDYIRDIVSLIDDLNSMGIKYQIFDDYIQTKFKGKKNL